MYTNKGGALALMRKSNAFDTAENVAAAVAVHGGYLVMRPIKVSAVYFCLTTTMVADTLAAQVKVTRRPTIGSATGEVILATLILLDTLAAGKVVYKIISPVLCYPGDELNFEHTVQCTSASTAAGAGYYGVDFEIVDEAVANCTDWVLST